jgi:hypothetical protein
MDCRVTVVRCHAGAALAIEQDHGVADIATRA